MGCLHTVIYMYNNHLQCPVCTNVTKSLLYLHVESRLLLSLITQYILVHVSDPQISIYITVSSDSVAEDTVYLSLCRDDEYVTATLQTVINIAGTSISSTFALSLLIIIIYTVFLNPTPTDRYPQQHTL